MKHLVTILALAAIASTAQAGTYTRAAKVQEACSERGEIVRQLYEMREKHNVKLEDFPTTDKQLYKLTAELFKLLDTGKPRSSHAAYMLGWAACMDKYN